MSSDFPKLVNLTPHALKIFHEAPFDDNWESFHQTNSPWSGQTARCTEKRIAIGYIDTGTFPSIPVHRVSYGDITGLPEPEENTCYIVSMMIAQAMPHRKDLYYPGELVRDKYGMIVGCIGLSQV